MNTQVIYLERKINDTIFLCIESYEYGTNLPLKTFTQAIKCAQKDYKALVKIYLERSLKESLCVELQVKDLDFVFNNVKFKTF